MLVRTDPNQSNVAHASHHCWATNMIYHRHTWVYTQSAYGNLQCTHRIASRSFLDQHAHSFQEYKVIKVIVGQECYKERSGRECFRWTVIYVGAKAQYGQQKYQSTALIQMLIKSWIMECTSRRHHQNCSCTLLHSSLISWHAYCFWPWQDRYEHKWVHGKWKGECSLAFHLETVCVSIYVLVLCTCSFDMA